MIKKITNSFAYKELASSDELPLEFAKLLVQAKIAIATAYAPYSNFRVGAAVLLETGIIVTGSNQENASFPTGICAERVTLSAASAMHPNVPIHAIAVSTKAKDSILPEPVAPCGICRQTLLEYEQRFQRNIEIILQGEAGKILWISSVKELLPLYFSGDNMDR